MMGHKYVLKEWCGKLFLNYPVYPFLSAALIIFTSKFKKERKRKGTL